MFSKLKRFDLSIEYCTRSIRIYAEKNSISNQRIIELHQRLSEFKRGYNDDVYASETASTFRMCNWPGCDKTFGYETNSMCSRCDNAHYCGTKCQLKHWNAGHKNTCRRRRQRHFQEKKDECRWCFQPCVGDYCGEKCRVPCLSK